MTSPGQASGADSAIAAELGQLQNDVLWTEKGHFISAGVLRAMRLILGVLATASSTTAVATIVADHQTVAGIFALAGALLSGLLTFLKPEELAQQHLNAGRKLGALRVDIRQTLRLDAATLQRTELRQATAELAQRKAAIDEVSPHVADASIWWAGRRIERGDYANSAGTSSPTSPPQ
jgi:hypothetical protein